MANFTADVDQRHMVPFDENFSLADFSTSVDDMPSKKP